MLEKFPCRQIAEVRACNGNIPVWTPPYEGRNDCFLPDTNWFRSLRGTIAEVNHLTSIRLYHVLASCGSLDKEANRWKFILPTEAYRGEGLSYYFAEPQDYIKKKTRTNWRNFSKKGNCHTFRGAYGRQTVCFGKR